jgi:hypothetical protein
VNLAPFSALFKRITGLPVFDAYTLGIHAHLATRPTPSDAR